MSHASSVASRAHARAVAMMVMAAVCWSTGGILVRQVSLRDPWEIVFWRSLAMVAFVAITLVVLHGRGMPRAVRAVGLPGLLSGLFLAGSFFFFIASLTRTTVANTFVLMSMSPFLAAIAARLILRERVPPRTWVAMAAAIGGVMVMFADSLDAGRLSGNLLALGVSCCFAMQVTTLRKFNANVSMLPTVMLAGLLSLPPAFILAGPFGATAHDLAVLGFMGCIQLGAGCLLMTAASRHLAATELGLLALLEPILGPVWVWALGTEEPSTYTLIGGAVVIGAVVVNQALGFRRADSLAPIATPTATREA